ncbi:MAG: DUF6100 family protein, partial [Clostridia bacterium]|nr:DUF6100 family protein [Clostridia bacterium]
MKSKFAFQKCTWLKKSEFAPRFRRRRCGEAAFLVNGIPFDKCREAMEDFNLRCLEKQIVGFSKRLKVSCAELIRISDKDLWNIKSEDDIVPLAYEVNEDIGSLGNYARFSKDKTKVLEAIVKCADSMGITVQKTNGVLEVTLPMILPTKSKTKADYLFDPIFHAMEEFSKTESLFMKEKAMMCIEFIYDKNNKTIPRGDHDNKEVKQVIDAIAPFVVRDDRDDYLSLCQISSEGDFNHTKVYVMPEKRFAEFF